MADEKLSLSSKQAQEIASKGSAEQVALTDSDIDAAKVAAMKAAELGILLVHLHVCTSVTYSYTYSSYYL